MRGVAVVTGASSGIGAATVRRLAAEGFEVVAAARRRDRLDELASSVPNVRAATLDVTDPSSVAALASSLDDVAVLVNNAGGAIGTETVEDADPADWQAMYETNVLGVLRVTQALLPALEAGPGGHIVVTGSIAGHLVYEGGGGYTAADRRRRRRLHRIHGDPPRTCEHRPAGGQAAGAGRTAQGPPCKRVTGGWSRPPLWCSPALPRQSVRSGSNYTDSRGKAVAPGAQPDRTPKRRAAVRE